MDHVSVRIIAAVAAAVILLSSLPGIVYAADTDRGQMEEAAEESQTEKRFEMQEQPSEEEKPAEEEPEPAEKEHESAEEEQEPAEEKPAEEKPEQESAEEKPAEEEPEQETEAEERKPFSEEAENTDETMPQAEEAGQEETRLQKETGSLVFDAQKEAGGLTVRIHAEQGVLPEGANVSIRELSGDEAESIMRKAEDMSGGAAALAAVDITFTDKEGREIQPAGMVQISFVDAAAYDTAEIYHVKDEAAGEMEEIRARVEGDDVLFENDSFSPYVLLGAAAEPDWTQGGAGTMKNVSSPVSLSLENAEWSNYYTWGRGYSSYNTTEALTVRYNVYYKGRNIGTASCINPQLDGDYADGRKADAVYEVTAPMLVKALYYGNSGPGRNVVQSVYNAAHDPDEDKNNGGPEIITHVAVSEIYSRLYPPMSKTGAGRGFAGPTTALLKNDVYSFVSKLNSLPVPSGYCVYLAHYNGNVQDFAMTSTPLGRGRLSIRKSSASEGITNGNSCYDLAGAEYRVYTSEEAAKSRGESGCVGRLKTGADAGTQELEVTAGVYYCIECVPAKGYLLDDTVYKVSVGEGVSVRAEPAEEPAGSLLPLRIRKSNRLEGKQQGRSLAGTQFEIRYYSGFYDAETLPEQPDRTWTVEAKEENDGGFAAELDENAEGDPLYIKDSRIFLPLGTVTVSEIKAAPGYKKDALFGEAEIYIGQIRRTDDAKGSYWSDIQGTREASDEEVLFDVQDTPLSPQIRTTACDAENGTAFSLAGGTVKIRDLVSCRNLIPGKKYTLSGRLVEQASGDPVLDAYGNEVTARKTFTASRDEEETVELLFSFASAESFAGKKAVVFERLTGSGPDLPGAAHEDLSDENQTIRFPRIQTQASDQSTGIRNTRASGEQVIIDTVFYENLIPGLEYTVKGSLVDKESGEPLRTERGEVCAEAPFTPEAESGTQEVCFPFDASGLEGKELVVFEELYLGEALIGVHADPEDENQTICLPDGATSAKDLKTGGRSSFPGEDCVIADTFSYKGLIPGHTYVLKGSLWNKDAEEQLDPELYDQVDEEGNVITEAAFTPAAADGETVIFFRVNAEGLSGGSLVCFEELFCQEALLVSHQNPEDEEQTIRFPQGQTEASDAESGAKMVLAQEKAIIKDTFSYRNLIPGEKYVITGSLRDKETGEAVPSCLSDESGNPLEDNCFPFVPEEASGEVDLYLCADTGSLAGKSAVVFERVSLNGAYVIIHENPEDEKQTLCIPSLRTEAEDQSDHDKTIASDGEVTVVDHVVYRNLIPGKTYRMTGVLMDKASGKEARDAGRTIRTEVSFVPREETGSIDVPLTFRAQKLRGGDYVVFEELALVGEDQALHVVGEHSDLHAASQTIRRPEDLRTGPRTEDRFALLEQSAVFAAVLGLFILTVIYRKRGSGRQST